MGRKSKIDSHPHRNLIVTWLASGGEYSDIIRDFPDLTWDDLDYYKQNKLHEIISKSPDLKAEVEGIRGNDTLAEVRALKVRALEILQLAQAAGDLKTALMGIREARGCLETCLKAEGQIDTRPQINILLVPEWIDLKSRIVAALTSHPQALEAVRNAIK